MEYRQYQNLTETYLNQVNEDTKQEELDESLSLAWNALKGLYALAKANKTLTRAGKIGTEVLAPGTLASTAKATTKLGKVRKALTPAAVGIGYEGGSEVYDILAGPTDAEGNPLYGQPDDDYDGDGQINADDLDDDNDGIPDTEDNTANPPRGPFSVIGAGNFIFDLPYEGSKLIASLFSSDPDDYRPDDDDGMNP